MADCASLIRPTLARRSLEEAVVVVEAGFSDEGVMLKAGAAMVINGS